MHTLETDFLQARMAPLGPLSIQARSHVGLVRGNNEDATRIDARLGLAVLADGMGGSQAGEVAAQMAVQGIAEHLAIWLSAHPLPGRSESQAAALTDLTELERQMRLAVGAVNRRIHQASLHQTELRGMGTTIVVAVWRGNHLLLGHAGDSRAYRLHSVPVGEGPHRIGQLQRLTHDHNARQSGEGRSGQGTALTRAIGVDEDVVLEIHRHRLGAQDVVMLCSDGLSDGVGHEALERCLRQAGNAATPAEAALSGALEQLIGLALEAGGRDNITAILARREGI